nr:hypothetical protein [uncultured Arsenicibacter sp.]
MASKRIEELMKHASAKDQAAFKESVQTLRENNVQLKPDNYGPQTPPRRAEQIRTAEPTLNDTVFPHQPKAGQLRRGAEKIGQARSETQSKTAQPEKAHSGKEQDIDR